MIVATQAPCSICGNAEFKAGPFGRLSTTKLDPVCTACGALERHRINRKVWKALDLSRFRHGKVLQFSLDPAIDRSWFDRLEISIYGARNSMDLQALPRGDGEYDLVICNHVLEHIPDDRKAFTEVMRILARDGVFQFSVPNPIGRDVTVDWGYPDRKQHDHYRVYGKDLIPRFIGCCPDVAIASVIGEDDSTGVKDYLFFASHSEAALEALLAGRVEAQLYQLVTRTREI